MAGRIPDQFIDELLARTDITDVVASRISLKKTGQNYSALCPFHNEKSPSFSLNPNKQFYYCFGCGAGGNAISFLMEHDHLDFVESIELLAKDAGLEVPRDQGAPDRYEQNAGLLNVLTESATFYQTQLTTHPDKDKIKRYLAEDRGLSGQIAKVFGLGFAPPGWDNLLKNLDQKAETQEHLFQAGMLVEKKDNAGHFYDRFRDRVMFPIRDSRGRVIAFGGRAFGDEKPKYLNSPETPIFHKSQELYGLYEAKQNTPTLDHIIVVEGYMDVIVLAQHGVTYSVATLGTSVNSQHIQKLFKLVSKITLCFDGDKAGRSAAIRGLEASLSVMQDQKQIRFLFLPEGEDPDSLIRKEGKELFLNRLDDSSSLAHVLFKHARQEVTLSDEEGEAQFAQNAMQYIQQMPECTLKSVLIKQLTEQSGIDSASLSITTQKPKYQSQSQPQSQNTHDNYLDDGPIHYDEPPLYYSDVPSESYTSTPSETYSKKNKKQFKPFKDEPSFNFPKQNFLKPLSQVENATLCLLLHPHTAQELDVSDPLLRQPNPETQTFGKVWRYFYKYPTKNAGHLLGYWANSTNYDSILYLLNHPDAHTKLQINNAKQEVKDVIDSMEEKLGLNASSQRLKNQGKETIKDSEGRTELLQWMEQMRKKKRP